MVDRMIELPLVMLGGLLGSAHCVGMCGGFALLIGSRARGVGPNIARQVVYSLGRIFTYAVLGGAAGYAGLRLAGNSPAIFHAQAALALVAGAALIVVGLAATGAVPQRIQAKIRRFATLPFATHRNAAQPHVACVGVGMLGTFLRAGGWRNVFLAGVFTGFLPCGLVYGFLALACSTASLPAGAMTMAVFGAGTMPLMMLAGTSASLFSIASRQRMLRLAAWCVVLAGAISLARGVDALAADARGEPACPLCAAES
jgi:sulfite exporter TauE/SafE